MKPTGNYTVFSSSTNHGLMMVKSTCVVHNLLVHNPESYYKVF